MPVTHFATYEYEYLWLNENMIKNGNSAKFTNWWISVLELDVFR